MAALRDDGYYVVKSGGSRGPADLVALKPNQTLLIQCKRDGLISRKEWNELYWLWRQLEPHTCRSHEQRVWPLLAKMPGVRGIEYQVLLRPLAHNERRLGASLLWVPDEVAT